MSEIWKPNVVVAAVVEREGKYLLVEEDVEGRRVYNQPAGHLDEGESLREAVVRETKEETAWTFDPGFLIGVYRYQVKKGGVTYLRFCFAGTVRDHDPTQALDDGVIRAAWFTLDEIKRLGGALRSPLVVRCIEDFRAGRRYPLDVLQDVG